MLYEKKGKVTVKLNTYLSNTIGITPEGSYIQQPTHDTHDMNEHAPPLPTHTLHAHISNRNTTPEHGYV
jgi:hypothetical protein